MGQLTGVVGRLQWGWNPAGSINGYTVTCSKTRAWTLRATVIQINVFNITQRPLAFIAPHANGAWRWMIRELQFPDGTDHPPTRMPFGITAALQPPDQKPEGPIYVVPVRPTRAHTAPTLER